MGSFSMTCSISGLGISVGTPVRCMLLTASPYEDDDPRKTWIVRTPPIRAVYNDYGSIEAVHPDDDFIAKLWLRGLREDVVEKGLGDNSVHDVPVAIDMSFDNMSFDNMLEAIQNRRLQVEQDVKHFWRRPRRGPGSDGAHVPALMRRVEELLESKFPGRVARGAAKDKYVVDEPVPYMVRVRFGEHGTVLRAALEDARTTVRGAGLTGVLVAGSGRYAKEADLLVFPLPSTTDDHVVGPQWDMTSDNKLLRVGLAMIREDVWQELITYPHCDYLSLDCVECGQLPSYHEGPEGRSCPAKSIDNKPYKKHAPGTKYAHGEVFPASVTHMVEQREWGNYVWYGIDAVKEGVRTAWGAVLDNFRCENVSGPDTTVVEDPSNGAVEDVEIAKLFADIMQAGKKEKERIAALPPEDRAAIGAEQKAQREAWQVEERRKMEHPFFGDFLIRGTPDVRLRGAWVFHDSVPGVIGVSEHFSMLLADKIEAPATLLAAVAELSAVMQVLNGIGVVLRPSVSSGPQYPEWPESKRFARSVLQIAEASCKEGGADKMPAPASLADAFELARRATRST